MLGVKDFDAANVRGPSPPCAEVLAILLRDATGSDYWGVILAARTISA